MERLSDVLPVSFFWMVYYALVAIDCFAVWQVSTDSVALGLSLVELSLDEFANWPVAVLAVSFRVAVVAKRNGLCAAEGFGDYVVLMGSGVFALKAFCHEREFTMGGESSSKRIGGFCWDRV